MSELEIEINGHAYHLFRAIWQHIQMKDFKDKLKGGEAILMMDFTE